MNFWFYPLRFEFLARDSLHFPAGKASNILRGALGVVLQNHDPAAWSRVFAPALANGPSGLADPPRPFVIRARHLDGCTLQPGDAFHFDVHIFSLRAEFLKAFVQAFDVLAHEGLGPRRGKAELRRVYRLAVGAVPEEEFSLSSATAPVSLDLDPVAHARDRVHVEFLSPTELKHNNGIAPRPEFPILFARIRDRLSALSRLYGPEPLEMDFQAIGSRTEAVGMTNCQVRRWQSERLSSRTGQTHSLGGFVGCADYEGDMTEFLPYLEAARWTGVGRQAVWGKGEIVVS